MLQWPLNTGQGSKFWKIDGMVAADEAILNHKPGGLASRRRLGTLCALAVQESGQSQKEVYLGRAGMDRFSTAVTRPPLSSAAEVYPGAPWMVNFTDQRSRINDQKRGISDALFIYHCSLFIEDGGGPAPGFTNIPTAASSAAYMQNLSQRYAPSLLGSTTLGSAAYGIGQSLVNDATNAWNYTTSGANALVHNPSALGLGSLQGGANLATTIDNFGISIANSAIAGNNLLNMGANKIAGLVDHGAAPFGMVPSIPTSNWSKGAFVSHDPARPVEKAVTGTAIAVATTFGGGAAEDAAPALAAASDATKGLMGKVSAIAEKAGGWIKGLFGKTEEEGVQANKLAGDAIRDAIAARGAPAQIEQTFNTVGGTRRVDVLKTGIRSTAIESKVGRTFLDARVRQELARDWWLRRQGQVGGVRWEFSRSKVTGELGPTATLLQKLQKLGFDVRINQ